MSATKDKNRNTWTVKFRYEDWQGNVKEVHKRGFPTKREAIEWERQFKLNKANDVDMTFAEFIKRYKTDRLPQVKYSTEVNKTNIIDKHILPYFGKKKLSEITTADVVKWQNLMIAKINPRTGKHFSKSYLKSVHIQLSAMLNFAVKYLGLKSNPAAIVGNMGTDKGIKLNFWTRDEYERFRNEVMESPEAFYCFEVLYWTGIREGELLALTLDDIDFEKGTIDINKTYHHINGREYTTSPKTVKSNRTITMPKFLKEELEDYIAMNYALEHTDRLFPVSKSFLSRNLHRYGGKAGLKQIRVHDLRHSHVSLLIDMGYSAVSIAERVGHESVEITYRYAHMFPSVQKDMASKLDEIGGTY